MAAPAVLDLNALSRTLSTFKGTRSELAKHLGISERTLYRRLEQHGLG
jgi:transcriptional regulator of acetoin/glycerol metabolism